jgi:hypothetical protein
MEIILTGITERKFNIVESSNPRGYGSLDLICKFDINSDGVNIHIDVINTYMGIEKYISSAFISHFFIKDVSDVSHKFVLDNIEYFTDIILIAQGQSSALTSFKSINTQFDAMMLQIEPRKEIQHKISTGVYSFLKK